MAITISGENNNDRITAQDGVIDTISGLNIAGIITASTFTGNLTGDVTGNVTGNLTGNVNHTSNLLLQIGGSERVRIDSGGRVGLGINNPGSYFSSYNRVVMGRTNDTGGMTIVSAPTSGGYIAFADGTSGNEAYRGRISYYHNIDALAFNTAASERVRIDSSGRVLIGTTTVGHETADDLTIASSGSTGISIRANSSNASNIHFGDGTSGADQYRGIIQYHHNGDSMRFFTNATEKVRIDTSGRLGIGTVSPSALLHLHKASGDTIQKIESSNGAASLELRHTNGYGYIRYLQDGAETFRAGQIAQFTSYSVYNPNSSLPYQLCVEGNGEVGINTHNPGDTLHLLRNNANHGIRLQRGGTNPGSAYVQVHSNGVLSLQGGNNIHYVSGGSQQHIWYRAGTEIGRFDTSGSFNASNIVQVGTTNDSGELRIGHDGSSYRARLVSNSANRLTIDADGPERIQMHGGVIYMRPLNTEKSAAFVANGAVELYYNDVKKFETTSAGADFTVTSGGQVNIFGLGGTNGLRISGPQSASSACLFFNTNHQNVSGGTDQYTIQCGGANHTLMFKHTDTTGNVVFELDDSEHVRIPQDSKALKIGAGQDLQLSHNATDSYVSNNTGHLRIGNTHDSSNIKFFTNNSTRWNIDSNGHFVPDSNNTFNIGNASYTIGDLFLSGNITSSGNFNTTSAAPLQFTNNSNTTSAKKTVIYANYNNTSNHAYNGLLIEMGHVTDSLSGEVRKFTIGERGGHTNAVIDQNGIHFTGGSTNPTLNADNGLNDYEEGTAFTSTGHATVHQAAYTKVGRMVTISFRASVTSGNTQAISLPFVHAGNHGDHILGCIVTAGVFKEIILSSSSSFTLTAGFSKGTLTYPTNT